MAGRVTITNNFGLVAPAVREAVGAVVAATTLTIESEVKASMSQEAKTGREYRRKGGIHRASAPDEAPAVDTSALMNAVQSDVSEAYTSFTGVVGVEGAEQEIALALELGTRDIQPRPFITPAAEKQREAFPKAVGGAVEGALRKVAVSG